MAHDYNSYSAKNDAYFRQLDRMQRELNQYQNNGWSNNDHCCCCDESIWTQGNSSSNPYDSLLGNYYSKLDQFYQEELEAEARAAINSKREGAITYQPETTETSQYRDGFDADSIATALYNAGENHGIFGWGTDEDVFEKYLGNGKGALNEAEIRAVEEAYQQKYGKSLNKIIKGEFSGKTEDQYLGKLQGAQNNNDYANNLNEKDRQQYIATLAGEFYEAVHGLGTDEEKVWEIMQLDKETLKEVINHYNNSGYADWRDFETAIKKDFSFGTEDKLLELYNGAMNS